MSNNCLIGGCGLPCTYERCPHFEKEKKPKREDNPEYPDNVLEDEKLK